MAIVLKVVDFVDVKKGDIYTMEVNFEDNKVLSAMASIKGFELSYDDEAFKRKVLRINPSVDVVPDDPFRVIVRLDYKCSDNNNNNMKGNVQILLLAEVE